MLSLLLQSYRVIMKPYHAVIIFLVIVCSAVVTGVGSYHRMQAYIVEDMNQALARTLAAKQESWITPDTILTYRSNLNIAALRDRSFVYYALENQAGTLCSRRMQWRRSRRAVAFQSYANCSVAAVVGMSDQRLPLSLGALAALWAVFSVGYFRKHAMPSVVFGRMVYVRTEHRFYDADHALIPFTPMQQQLMELFFAAPAHRLGKKEICEALWPKKPDASETLYTLIRRLKPVVEQNSNLRIVSDRGRCYELTERAE